MGLKMFLSVGERVLGPLSIIEAKIIHIWCIGQGKRNICKIVRHIR